ncbi:tetratricopeptide (TPR) repeat protein [Stakelama sediminis]|uniref:Tetratricopeptide (TPR) repeat protein n=1 Tax=Stakelama sediminis TaxID=463200 RepID=A0A840YXE0_9SPHN|nr:hypothetical protein [Stakelama sediminis]MBB5718401.1 tetratricopeptide (TPR) repeat protein [Stakelama sediminis]
MDGTSRIAREMAQGEEARRTGRLEEARACFAEAITAARDEVDPLLEAQALEAQARVAQDGGNIEWALHDQQEAIQLYRLAGDGPSLAAALCEAGNLFLEQQQLAHAANSLCEALDLYRATPDASPLAVANAVRSTARLAEALGEREEACRYWQDARERYAALGDPLSIEQADAAEIRLVQLAG